MSSSSDNFERLLKLLALKRHEQPPPRYFSEFPGRVVGRLEHESSRQAASWWRRWTMNWESSPVVACSLGVVACTLLLAGLSYFLWVEPPAVAGSSSAGDGAAPSSTPSLNPVGSSSGAFRGMDFVLGGNSNSTANSESAGFPFGGPSVRPLPATYIPRNN